MDLLRSCYDTKMRFYSAEPGTLTDVKWYFAPHGAKILPFRHRFGSLNWAPRRDLPTTLGENKSSPRPYSKGADTTGFAGQGSCTLGSKWFAGVPNRPAFPHPVNCCDGPNPTPALMLGASAAVTFPPSYLGTAELALEALALVVGPPSYLGTAELALEALALVVGPPSYLGTAELALEALALVVGPPSYLGTAELALEAVADWEPGPEYFGVAELALEAGTAIPPGPWYVGTAELALEALGAVVPSPQYVGTAELALEALGAVVPSPQYVGTAELALEALGAVVLPPHPTGAAQLAVRASGTVQLPSQLSGAAQLAVRAASTVAASPAVTGLASTKLKAQSTVVTPPPGVNWTCVCNTTVSQACKATFTSSNCSCMNGLVVNIDYQISGPDAGYWTGSRPSTCGSNTLTVKFGCDVTTTPHQAKCYVGGCAFSSFSPSSDPSSGCSPFKMVFKSYSALAACCGAAGTFDVKIEER